MAGDLTVRAVVEQIEYASVGRAGAFLDWIVRTRVLEIIAGEFAGEQFSFRIHSPSRSGLEVGVTFTIRAEWTGTGYRVDEHQWSGAPR